MFSTYFFLKKNKKLNSVHYIRHFVRVPVLYLSMFFLDFLFVFQIAFFDLPGTTFGRFWSLPTSSKSAPDLQKWCSRRGETPVFKKSTFFIKKVVSEKTWKNGPNKSSTKHLKVGKSPPRQPLKNAPESASEPWSFQGRLLGRPGITFPSFSVPFCIKIMIISFSLSTTGHKFEIFETENRTQADWYEPNPAEKLSAKPMSH